MTQNQQIKVYVENDEAAEKLRASLENIDGALELSYRDELDKLSNKVEKLGEALRAYQESGINWKVFNRYLRGMGIAQGEIDNVMRGVKDFFAQFDIEIDD